MKVNNLNRAVLVAALLAAASCVKMFRNQDIDIDTFSSNNYLFI